MAGRPKAPDEKSPEDYGQVQDTYPVEVTQGQCNEMNRRH